MELLAVGVVIGVIAGYGLREFVSRQRRARARRLWPYHKYPY